MSATPVWTYSHYRAMLRRNGENFAIVTPDGQNDLDPEQVKILLDALNASPERAALERIAEFGEVHTGCGYTCSKMAKKALNP